MNDLVSYINKFKTRSILVLGDIIGDEFIEGNPERLSREAPVLILRQQERRILPGGAANAGNNICSLGGDVKILGLVGKDESGRALLDCMQEKGMNTSRILKTGSRPTTLKTRVLAGGKQVVKQQIVRIDHLDSSPVGRDCERIIIERFHKLVDDIDAILLSDYGNGLFTSAVIEEVLMTADELGKIVAVDSRYSLPDFRGASIATPNLEEAGIVVGREIKSQREVEEAGKIILGEMDLDHLLITQGGDGMTLFAGRKNPVHIPAANFTEVYDVTGAGDTVVGTLVLALASGASPLGAVRLANYAAGIVVRKSGVATVSPEELKEVVKENDG
ncbi:MAG: bifunctional heptose 7-phosphate kinase/heptose 1-phosphate adenyltransferase [Halanaerobiaceae bacterium]